MTWRALVMVSRTGGRRSGMDIRQSGNVRVSLPCGNGECSAPSRPRRARVLRLRSPSVGCFKSGYGTPAGRAGVVHISYAHSLSSSILHRYCRSWIEPVECFSRAHAIPATIGIKRINNTPPLRGKETAGRVSNHDKRAVARIARYLYFQGWPGIMMLVIRAGTVEETAALSRGTGNTSANGDQPIKQVCDLVVVLDRAAGYQPPWGIWRAHRPCR